MVDTSNEENNVEASVIQMQITKKANEVDTKETKVKAPLTEDISNKQLNRDKKKSFKSQRKEERKKLSRLVAAEENSMKIDEESSTDRTDETPMVDSDDDSYNFAELLPR